MLRSTLMFACASVLSLALADDPPCSQFKQGKKKMGLKMCEMVQGCHLVTNDSGQRECQPISVSTLISSSSLTHPRFDCGIFRKGKSKMGIKMCDMHQECEQAKKDETTDKKVCCHKDDVDQNGVCKEKTEATSLTENVKQRLRKNVLHSAPMNA